MSIRKSRKIRLFHHSLRRDLRHGNDREKVRREIKSILTMSLAEIQEAIEKLAPEERAALREWLDEFDPDAMAVIRKRVRQNQGR